MFRNGLSAFPVVVVTVAVKPAEVADPSVNTDEVLGVVEDSLGYVSPLIGELDCPRISLAYISANSRASVMCLKDFTIMPAFEQS